MAVSNVLQSRAVNEGALSFLHKPFQLADLSRAVADALKA